MSDPPNPALERARVNREAAERNLADADAAYFVAKRSVRAAEARLDTAVTAYTVLLETEVGSLRRAACGSHLKALGLAAGPGGKDGR